MKTPTDFTAAQAANRAAAQVQIDAKTDIILHHVTALKRCDDLTDFRVKIIRQLNNRIKKKKRSLVGNKLFTWRSIGATGSNTARADLVFELVANIYFNRRPHDITLDRELSQANDPATVGSGNSNVTVDAGNANAGALTGVSRAPAADTDTMGVASALSAVPRPSSSARLGHNADDSARPDTGKGKPSKGKTSNGQTSNGQTPRDRTQTTVQTKVCSMCGTQRVLVSSSSSAPLW